MTDEASGRKSMDSVYAKGLVWTAGAKWGVQIVSWVITIWVARILVPSDYGIVGMARVYVMFATMLSEAGLGEAVVRYQGLETGVLRQLNAIAITVGILVCVLSIALAAPLASFFSTPDLEAVLSVMSMVFLASAFRVVPYAMLRRNLEYRFLAVTDGSSAVLGGFVTLGLALSGAGYWALVGGALTESLLLTLILLVRQRIGFTRPRMADIVTPARYGLQIIRQRFAGLVYMASDKVIIGRVLGDAPLGAYNFGANLAGAPVDKISDIAGRVTSTVLAAVQESKEEMARYFLRTTEALAMVTMPACVGMALVAPDLVQSVLGPKWTAMVVPLQVLSLVAVTKALQPLGAMVGNLRGRESQLSNLNIAMAVVFPPLIWHAASYGINAVALAWLAVFPVFAACRIAIGCRSIDVSGVRYIRALWPAVSSTIVMAAAVFGAQQLMGGSSSLPRMAVAVATGSVTYGGTMLVVHPQRVRALVSFAQKMRSPRRSP